MPEYKTFAGWEISPIEAEVMQEISNHKYDDCFFTLSSFYDAIIFGTICPNPIPDTYFDTFLEEFTPKLINCGKKGWIDKRQPMYYVLKEGEINE